MRVFYDNNSSEIVPVTDSNVTVSGYNPELLGQQAITISYMGLTREFYVTVSAPTGKCGDNLYFEFDEDSGTLSITGTGAMYDYEWDMPWRGYSERILKVELSDGLTTLGKGAFTCCGNLKSIDLPDTLTTISDHALEECHALTSLTIPASVKYIGVYAICACVSLTDLVLSEGLETIDMYAFMGCHALKNVVLPESLKHLGGGAFEYCTGLEEAQLPETLETVPWHTFIDCTSLKEIVIPKTVTEISYYAFAGCTALEDVTFEGTAPYVDAGLFGDAYPFNYVTADAWYPGEEITWTDRAKAALGGNLTWRPIGSEVPSEPVYPCAATVKIKASVRSEPSTYATKVASLEVGTQVCVYETTVTNNMEWARIDSGWVPLEYLDLSGNSGTGSVTGGSCGENLTWSFDRSSGKLTITGSGPMKDYYADSDNQGNMEIPSPWYTFRDQILSVELEENVTSVGVNAFYDCTALANISIPSTVTEIGRCAFDGCGSLKNVVVSGNNEYYCSQSGVLFTGDMTRLIKYPAQKENKLYIIPDSVCQMDGYAFEGNHWLERVSIPDSITQLEEGTFDGCAALTEVSIPDSVIWYNPFIFRNCTSLTRVVLPKSITWLGEYMFAGCTSLKTVEMPEKIEGIATGAFSGCTALEEITLPEGMTELFSNAFQDCTSLKSVTIPSTLYRNEGSVMRSDIFANCTALEQVIFTGPAVYFGENAFKGVTATAVYSANDVTWTDAVKQNYGGNLTWKPMLSRLELYRYPAPLVVGESYRVLPQMHPSDAAADLTFTVSGTGELRAVGKNWSVRGTAPGTAVITATDTISGLTAEVTVPVVNVTTLTCPQVSDPFTLSAESMPVFSFTPTETKRYSLTLENVENIFIDYGDVTVIDVVDRAKNIDVTCDASFLEETTTQEFFTLEEGVTYRISPAYFGDRSMENVTLRLSEVAEVTGIEIPYDSATIWFDPEAGILGDTIEAYFRPVQALGDITWTSSNPDVLSVDSHSLNVCGFLAHKEGTAVVTATCGDYSDSVTVTVKRIPKLTLNVPFRDTCGYQTYSFTAPETGIYRFTCSADFYLNTSDGWFDEKLGYASLEAGETCSIQVNNTKQNPGEEYTLLVEKMVLPTSITLYPSLDDQGYVTVETLYSPKDSIDWINTVDLDNSMVLQAFSWNRTSGRARIIGEGETTITVITEQGLMADRKLAVGTCGRNLCWMFDKASGKLTIAGSGAMYDYGWDGAPWKAYAEEILKVELPDTMTALGAYAFDGCINLTELKLPEGISVIPKYALNRCESLTDLKIPDSVKVIGDTAISDCNRLTSLVLPEGLKTVEDFAFCWNAELKEVKLPESLKSLGSNAFSNCPALETVNIPESIRTIEWGTFDGCTSLKEITIPRSVTEIAYWSFTGCTGLKTVTFEGSAPATSDWSPPFAGSTADAWYPGEDTTWTEEARMRLGAELNWMPYGAVENRLILDSAVFNGLESVCIDGMEYDIQKDGSFWYIDLPDGNAKVMTAYEYHVDDPLDAQTRYPISMRVWTLKNDGGIYTATRQEAFDNIFQYSGVSIRVTGKKGIRMITSVEDGKKTALTGAGLAGYTLKEYGTAVAWSSHLRNDKPLVLGKAWTKSSYAYKQGVADLVFRQMDGFFLYTNVLVNFSNEQCRNLIAMRPYMILQDPEGEEITLYGGVVERSIGYIALMNRTAFMPDTDAYEFIWDIIHYVYGDSYDQDYFPSWTKPVM